MNSCLRARGAVRTTAAAVLFVGLAACTSTETTNTVSETSTSVETGGEGGGSDATGGSGGSDGGWSVTSERDAITDEQVNKAKATLDSGEFRINVAIGCGSRGVATYEFAAFDKDGAPQTLRWRETPNNFVDAVEPYDLRLDGGEGQSRFGYGRRYNNAFLIGDNLSVDYAAQMAAAQDVVIRFQMLNGDATLEWDQTDPAVSEVLRPCLRAKPRTSAPTPPPPAEPTTDESDSPIETNE